MLQHGHELTAYTYDPRALMKCNLGADVLDAREVVAETDVAHRYRAVGKFNMFANLFRLELQRQGKGVWVDLDCYLIRPLVLQSEYVFGLSSHKKINNAVLRLPHDCPMIDDYMRAITADPLRLPWSSLSRRLRREIEILMGQSQPHALVKTNIGPRALTYFAKKHGLLKHAMPVEAYNPITNKEVLSLVDPDPSSMEAKLTAQTVLVHLWRATLERLGLLARLPPATSYLGRGCAQLGISR
jgi:hypothetical protein